jgi:hypothetical protein
VIPTTDHDTGATLGDIVIGPLTLVIQEGLGRNLKTKKRGRITLNIIGRNPKTPGINPGHLSNRAIHIIINTIGMARPPRMIREVGTNGLDLRLAQS